MNLYYYVQPYACAGEYSTFSGSKNEDSIKSLKFSNGYLESSFFEMEIGGHFVTNELKLKLEREEFPEISFSKVDKLEYPLHLKNFFYKYDKDSFWKIDIPSNSEILDFHLWDSRLLVLSQRALNCLMENNGFKDIIAGNLYGKEYEVIINRFFIMDKIDYYFTNILQKEQNIVNEKMAKISEISKQRRGLNN